VGILLVALLAAWLAYSPGITGGIQFDDYLNLVGLADINDERSIRQFIFSGRGGPLGRPLALATFVPEASAWPSAPEVFLRTNILIHLLNGVLVTWFLYLLGTARHQTERQSAVIAAGSASIWMLMPILASSSLFIVQRMTTLSATFVLLGAIGYLYARRGIERRPLLALCGMTLALGAGAVLGVLSKENGALLLMFMPATEATLLRRPRGIAPAFWRSWFGVVLVLPGIILIGYLATRLPYSEGIILRRDFTGFERLITQAKILWNYLYLAFVPNLPGLGPFHDDYPLQRTLLDFTTLGAVTGWAILIAAAIALRKRAPLFAFAVAWYLLGHSLESTALPLELYFEHRNYLPLLGPVYAVVACTLHAAPQWRRLFTICIAAYGLVLGGVLYSVTSLWGTPAIGAEMWYIYKPNSIRAAERLAQQMEQVGDLQVARKVFREVREKNPEAHYLDLRILLYSCVLDRGLDHSSEANELVPKLRTSLFSHSASRLIQFLHNNVHDGECPGLERKHVYQLAQALIDNPRFDRPNTTQVIRTVLAKIAVDQNDLDLAMKHIEDALSVEPDPNTLIFFVTMLNNANLHDMTSEVLALARKASPRNPRRASIWAQEVERLSQAQMSIQRDFQKQPQIKDVPDSG
jgi:tetratricopeptide (TPR) repeat protein